MPFIKLIRIVFIFLKFKLNEIFPKEVLPFWLKVIFFLSPFNLIPTNKKIGVRLAEALETAGPIFVKFGQLLSTRPDFLDEEIIQELQRFQNNLKPFSSKEAMEIIEKDLGRPINELFADFNFLPLAAASIAQVHEATLKSGEEVVVKVVRPNLEKKIRVGGLVMPGSIKREKITLNEEKVEKISFLITDNNNEVRVSYIGILPDLFKEGQGAVIEGVWQHSQNYFKASLVLAKHDENYMPPEVKEILDRDEKK